jgi:hypothetical protein
MFLSMLSFNANLRFKFMPHPSTQNHYDAHLMGLALHLNRCVPGCMWLLAEGMQSFE